MFPFHLLFFLFKCMLYNCKFELCKFELCFFNSLSCLSAHCILWLSVTWMFHLILNKVLYSVSYYISDILPKGD